MHTVRNSAYFVRTAAVCTNRKKKSLPFGMQPLFLVPCVKRSRHCFFVNILHMHIFMVTYKTVYICLFGEITMLVLTSNLYYLLGFNNGKLGIYWYVHTYNVEAQTMRKSRQCQNNTRVKLKQTACVFLSSARV